LFTKLSLWEIRINNWHYIQPIIYYSFSFDEKESKNQEKTKAAALSLWLVSRSNGTTFCYRKTKTNPRTIAIRFSHKFTPNAARCFFGLTLFAFRYLT
jgi:hypothetical protein